MKLWAIISIVVLPGMLFVAGCGNKKGLDASRPSGAGDPAPMVTGTLSASDQSSDGMTIKVAKVFISGVPGWIVVHSDLDGRPGPVVGKKAIPIGESTNVVITLDQAVTTGVFWPMLHVDAGTVGTYEPEADVPLTDGHFAPIMKKVMLTVKAKY